MKYLFEAHFKDGSVIVQDEKDLSIFEEGRSAYFDVTKKGIANIAFFGLASADHTYVVDLSDGHFEIDGVAFTLQPAEIAWLPPGGTYELVYWRDHQHDYGDAPAHRMQWRFGWNYTMPDGPNGEKGQKYSQTIALA